MKHVEEMIGNGTAIVDSGERIAVQYCLEVMQEQIPAASLDDPTAIVPGPKNIVGWIRPVCHFGDILTLQMDDGRKLKFFFTDMQGNIALNKWVG